MIALLLCISPHVTDGDTIRCANQPAAVRLLGIDAPDHVWVPPCVRHFGNHVCDNAAADASTATLKRVLIGTVKIRPVTHDRYGRTVAEVFAGRADVQCYQLRVRSARYIVSYDTGGIIARRCPAIVRKAEK